MTDATRVLASWRDGPSRDAIVRFLDDAASLPPAERVACFDNDGTMWCERPTYVQFDFFVDALTTRIGEDPSLGDRPEYAAILSGDAAAIGEIGLERIAMALTSLFEGMAPQDFTARARDFMARATHRTLHRPARTTVYQPMLELIDELRARDFTVGIVTGGGTEFVRELSKRFYGVEPGMVVGTLIGYAFDRDDTGRPVVRRTIAQIGTANEGGAKLEHIQSQIGRVPLLAAGNSGGDREMLEWACAGDGPGLAILVDHDDAEREFRYVSSAQTFTESEPITDVGARLGWTVVSMANDWATVFGDDAFGGDKPSPAG
jgi:phosphoserine phosphatase